MGNLSTLKNLKSPVWLLISHADVTGVYGGSQKYQREMIADLVAQGWTVMQVFPHRVDRRFLFFKSHGQGFGVNINLQPMARGWSGQKVLKLVQNLSQQGVLGCVNVQNIYQWPLSLFQRLLSLIRCPIVTQFHEYSFVCESLFMRYNGQYDCGAVDPGFDSALCQTCHYGVTRAAWQNVVLRLLQCSQSVVVPSVGMAQGVVALYPHMAEKVQILPHLSYAPLESRPRELHPKLRVAFLGLAHAQKGWDTFVSLSQSPTIQANVLLYHLGGGKYTHDASTMGWTQVVLDGKAQGSDAAIEALKAHQIDLVILWSQVRESYSYTVFEAMAAGVPVLTHQGSGNIAAVVANGEVPGLVFGSDAELMAFLENQDAMVGYLQTLPQKTFYALTPQFPLPPTV